MEGIKDDPRAWGPREWVNGALFRDAKVGRGLGLRWGGGRRRAKALF